MAEEIARSLEGSDLTWMREAGRYLRDPNGVLRAQPTCHYAIPSDDHRSLVRLGLVKPHGGEVCGMSVCKQCHDAHYAQVSKQDNGE